MTELWSPKQFAMELLARGVALSPESAIATAVRFERLWDPQQARMRAEGEELFRISKVLGPEPTQQEIEDAIRRAREAGQVAYDRAERISKL